MVEDADKIVVILEETEPLPDYILNSNKYVRWNIPDPKGQDLETTRKIKNEIKKQIDILEV